MGDESFGIGQSIDLGTENNTEVKALISDSPVSVDNSASPAILDNNSLPVVAEANVAVTKDMVIGSQNLQEHANSTVSELELLEMEKAHEKETGLQPKRYVVIPDELLPPEEDINLHKEIEALERAQQ